MCGRYAITLPPEAMRRLFGYVDQPNFPHAPNVARRSPSPSSGRQGAAHFGLVRWGFCPVS